MQVEPAGSTGDRHFRCNLELYKVLLCTAPQEGWLPHKVKGEGLSQDDAKEDAAFEAVKYLHHVGVLDGRFFVAGRQEARRALGLRPSGHGTKRGNASEEPPGEPMEETGEC